MKTSQQMLEDMLLTGQHINKFLFYERTGTVCLAQRILDIRQTKGWFIRSKSIEGKGSLREYWLEKEEIARIKKLREDKQTTLGLFGENKYE